MDRRHLMSRLVWVLLLWWSAGEGEARAETDPVPDRYQFGPDGEFRVTFDPGNQVQLGVGYAFGGPESGSGSRLEVGLSLRRPFKGYEPADAEAFWVFDTQLLTGRVDIDPDRASGQLPGMRVALLSGRYVHYTREPYVTLPGERPRRLWFPFNTGFSVQLLEVDTRALSPGGAELNVLSSQLLLDFLRLPHVGTWGRLGVGIRYDLLLSGLDGLIPAEAVSTFAPFTATSITFHHESRGGLFRIDGGLEVIPRWSRRDGWSRRIEGSMRAERVVLAVNDQPVAIYAGATFLEDSLSPSRPFFEKLQAVAGVRLGFNLD